MARLMPLPLTVCCFSEIQIGFTFLVPAHLGSPGKRAIKRVCVTCGSSKVHQNIHTRYIIIRKYETAGTFRVYTQIKKKNTHTRLTALCLGLPGSAGTRLLKPIWILLKQETVSGSGISWAICKSAPRSRQITMPAPHHLVFYRPDALPATQPTASEH